MTSIVADTRIGGTTVMRPDAQLAVVSDGLGHALTTRQNPNGQDECADADFLRCNDGITWVQAGTRFTNFSGGNDSPLNNRPTMGEHIVSRSGGVEYDTVPLLRFGLNSVRMCAGPTRTQAWQIPPAPNWAECWGTFAVGAPNADGTQFKQGLMMGYSFGAGKAYLQNYDVELSTFLPLSIARPEFAIVSSQPPRGVGDLTFELTSNTALTIKVKGSDGVVRSGTVTLA